jgi:hypothetical protein
VDPNATAAGADAGKEDKPVNIFAAAEKGDVEGVDEALRMGVEVDARSPAGTGATPLIAAAVAQQLAVVAHLLERGADPNAVKNNLDGALHWACYRGTGLYELHPVVTRSVKKAPAFISTLAPET